MPDRFAIRLVSATAALTLALSACTSMPSRSPRGTFVKRQLTIDGLVRRYQVFVPSSMAGGAKPAVLLFLHGSGERGSDGVAQTESGLGPYVRDHAHSFPAIVVFPQVPEHEQWTGSNARMAFATLNAATVEFHGNASRTYLTGMSMGGYGTWELAMMQPRRFAALVPVCGGVIGAHQDGRPYITQVFGDADPYAAIARRLGRVPVWIFHGAQDDVVSPDDDRKLIAAFHAAGDSRARYTEFPDANHDAWDPAYAETPALWTWLFAQRRDEAPPRDSPLR